MQNLYHNLSAEEEQAIIEPRTSLSFVETGHIKSLTGRVLRYVKAGFPVHLRGVSGTGKTTLALHIASKIGRPAVLIHGDDQYKTSDLIGGEHGYRKRFLRDNFIAKVLKVEEDMQKRWIDNRLTIACRQGFTLIYDEFTRSRPEANNVLLSVLQEGVLDLPAGREDSGFYLKVHPQFSAIFTSNPEEYAGTHRAQDALRDRMVTVDLDFFDRETEIAITRAKSGLDEEQAAKIVDIVRDLRKSGAYEFAPTIRGCVMIAKALKVNGGKIGGGNGMFGSICQDILTSETSRFSARTSQNKVRNLVKQLIVKHRKTK